MDAIHHRQRWRYIFVKGEFVTDNEGVALAHDNCWNVTKVDAKDFGSADMQHWEVGGK